MGEELGNVNVNVVMNKCGNCRNGGHSSKECSEKVALKLFGVRIFEEKKRDELMKKSFSVENLQATVAEHGVIDRGYLSDGLVRSRRDRHGRKKGVPWTEEEHRTFLLGLKKLGKGDWRGISRKFVTTRTPTQVASHAQKYFLRQQVNSKKKRRSSLFDMPVVEDPSPRSFEIAKLMETPRLEVPQAAPMATNSGAINTHGASYKEVIPSLMLRQSEARLFPTMAAFGNAAEFTNQFYRFQVKPSGENFINSSSKPFVCQQLVGPNCGSKMEGGGSSSSTVNTELELTIAPPGGVHGPANKLLGGASKMGGIIQVI